MLDAAFRWWARCPDHPAKLRVLSAINKAILHGRVGVRTKYGTLLVDYDDWLGRTLVLKGEYEPRTLERIVRILGESNRPVFVDVGANFGVMSLAASANSNVRVVAVEPDPINTARLIDNLKLNDRSNVSVCNLALGCTLAVRSFSIARTSNRGTMRVTPFLATSPPTGQCGAHVFSPLVRLDDLAKQLGIARIDLLKIDVEGYELDVLKGIDFTSHIRPANIILEYADSGAAYGTKGRSDVHAFLTNRGYSANDVEGSPIASCSNPVEQNAWFRDANEHSA
jgi:FkbM family methyltransferase